MTDCNILVRSCISIFGALPMKRKLNKDLLAQQARIMKVVSYVDSLFIFVILLILLPLSSYAQEGTITIKKSDKSLLDLTGFWEYPYYKNNDNVRQYYIFEEDGDFYHLTNLWWTASSQSPNPYNPDLREDKSGEWSMRNDTLWLYINSSRERSKTRPYTHKYVVEKTEGGVTLYRRQKSERFKGERGTLLVRTDLDSVKGRNKYPDPK